MVPPVNGTYVLCVWFAFDLPLSAVRIPSDVTGLTLSAVGVVSIIVELIDAIVCALPMLRVIPVIADEPNATTAYSAS